MATLLEVERAMAAQHPANGVIVADDQFRTLAFRPPADGGGAVLVVLGDPFPGVRRDYRPDRGDDVGDR